MKGFAVFLFMFLAARAADCQSVLLGGSAPIIEFDYDCVQDTAIGDWAVVSDGARDLCAHQFVEAERWEVNERYPFTNMVYCPCGCPKTIVRERICGKCLLYQRSETVIWWKMVNRQKTEFQTLKEKIKQ